MSNQLVVAKFGGTSVGTAEAIRKSAEIVFADPTMRLVVVSATSGTTNILLDLYEKAADKNFTDAGVAALRDRHLTLAAELGCDQACAEPMDEMLEELAALVQPLRHIVDKTSPAGKQILDQLLSVGERLASLIVSEYFRAAGKKVTVFDARLVIRTDDVHGKAEPNPDEIRMAAEIKLRPVLDEHEIVVTQGFIGATATGATTTLGRGGGDYSAALFAEGLRANDLKIWTDVSGIKTMDPRIVPTAQSIPEISFAEAAEMANFGAKVLHPATLWPAIRNRIRVFVGNTFDTSQKGTWIYPEVPDEPLVRAIAIRQKQTLITVSSLRMLNTPGFLEKLFGVLAKHQLSIDLVTTSEVSVALTLDSASQTVSGRAFTDYRRVLDELRTFSEVTIEEDLSLVAIIGNRMTQTSGIGSLAFGAISEFNIRLICQGASSHNICFLVRAKDAVPVVERLHRIFIGETKEATGI